VMLTPTVNRTPTEVASSWAWRDGLPTVRGREGK